MSPRSRRILIVVILLLLALLALLFSGRCSKPATPPPVKAAATVPPPIPAKAETPAVAVAPAPEVLTPASVTVPVRVEAGAAFRVNWTGPNNAGDFLTIVRADATAAAYQNYQETKHGSELTLTAPMEPGEWEVRYVAVRSKTVLGRAPLTVAPVTATLIAADEAVLGTSVSVAWTGPNNTANFICIVRAGARDDEVGNYADAASGSPVKITAPVENGPAEIRYVSGQGRKVLARRPLTVTTPQTILQAQADVVAGTVFSVTWQGPKNPGDYLTVVPKSTPDGQYRNYTDTAKGSPLELTAPIDAGDAEIRYMTGTQARVLARRAIRVTAAPVTLEAVAEIVAGSPVTIAWTGPKNAGDYLTIVPKSTRDGQYGNYTDAANGTPLKVTAPIQTGPAEIRYMSGQGAKVLARRAIEITPAQIRLTAPAHAAGGTTIAVEWSGPDNVGDYLTVVAKNAKDGATFRMTHTARGTPAKVDVPKEAVACEVRYMSGQGNIVLARAELEVK